MCAFGDTMLNLIEFKVFKGLSNDYYEYLKKGQIELLSFLFFVKNKFIVYKRRKTCSNIFY